jgi:hypothetical protein
MANKKKKKKKKKSKGRGFLIFLIVLIIILLVLLGLVLLIKNKPDNPLSKAVNKAVTKGAINAVIKEETGSDISIEQIQENMSPEDSEAVDEIIDKYSQSGLLPEAIDSLTSNGGDFASTAAELESQVSPEDIETLYELYARYGDAYE